MPPKKPGSPIWPASVPYVCPRPASPQARHRFNTFSQELHAYATLAAADGAAPGAATLAIGLAPPRAVSPASEGVWAGDGLTVRPLAGAAELEVSLYGARRCRFARVEGTPPPRQRGL
jgi:hypothetical protein